MTNELMRKDCSVTRASGDREEIIRRVVIDTDDDGCVEEIRIEEDSPNTFGWDIIDAWSPAGQEVSRFEH